MPDPTSQPLDHRTFLQQFVLGCVTADWADPASMLSAAEKAWEGIETSVAKAEEAAAKAAADARAAKIAALIAEPGVYLCAERLPPRYDDRLDFGHGQRRIAALQKGGDQWENFLPQEVSPTRHTHWKFA